MLAAATQWPVKVVQVGLKVFHFLNFGKAVRKSCLDARFMYHFCALKPLLRSSGKHPDCVIDRIYRTNNEKLTHSALNKSAFCVMAENHRFCRKMREFTNLK